MLEYMKSNVTYSHEHGELCVFQLLVGRQKHRDIVPYNQATVVQVPKPPPYTSQLNLKRRRQQQQRKQQAEVWSRRNNQLW